MTTTHPHPREFPHAHRHAIHSTFPPRTPAAIGAILTIQRSARRGDEYNVEVRDLQKIKLAPTDVIVSVFIPYGPPKMLLKYYKAAARHRNAHAAVNAAFSVVMDEYMVCEGQPLANGMWPFTCTVYTRIVSFVSL